MVQSERQAGSHNFHYGAARGVREPVPALAAVAAADAPIGALCGSSALIRWFRNVQRVSTRQNIRNFSAEPSWSEEPDTLTFGASGSAVQTENSLRTAAAV